MSKSKSLSLAIRLHKAGDLVQAKKIYMNILSDNPDNIEAIWNLGILAYSNNDFDEAFELVSKAISIRPDLYLGYNLLGIIQNAQGKHEKATKCFQKATDIKPDFIDAIINLGNTYYRLKFYDDAVEKYKQVVAINHGSGGVFYNLGKALKETGNIDEAIKCYEKAIEFKPDYVNAWYDLGTIFHGLGLIKKAVECFEKVIEIKPDHTNSHRHLSKSKKYIKHDSHITKMVNLLSGNSLSVEQKIDLSFALGKAFEDIGEYDTSFKYLAGGNKLVRDSFNYSIENEKEHFKSVKKFYSIFVDSQKIIPGNLDCTPIFILGMPRSGTSLVEQILSSHSLVYGGGELEHFWTILSTMSDEMKSLGNVYSFFLDSNDKVCVSLGNQYVAKIRGHSIKEKFITDKMTLNFLFIGLIFLALPNAKIIHCVRDPMDTCFSIFENYFATARNFAYELTEIGHYYLLYKDLMAYWKKYFPETIYDIKYEDLINDQKNETEKLLEFCKLEWEDSCLSFYKNNRMVRTASISQVRKPIYKDSVKRWRNYESHLKPLKEVLSTLYP